MFYQCKTLALHTLKSNNITEFPVPIYCIEQIIIDHNYDIVIAPGLNKSCIINTTLFTGNLPDFEFRASLSHEVAHILFQDFFIHSTQYEARADAFAAYFLMPPSLFEKEAEYLNTWDLSEKYGVPESTILLRKYLMTGDTYHVKANKDSSNNRTWTSQ